MIKFRPLTIHERYFSEYLLKKGNQKIASKDSFDAPDTTATFADANPPMVKLPNGNFFSRNKEQLIAAGVFFAIVISGIIYMNWKNNAEKKRKMRDAF